MNLKKWNQIAPENLIRLTDVTAVRFSKKPSQYFFVLTHRFPAVLYALVPAGAKLAHFGIREEIAQD